MTYLDYTENDEMRSSLKNYATIISLDRFFHNRLRFDLLNAHIEVSGFSWWPVKHRLTDTDENNIRLYINSVYGNENERKIHSAIDIEAHKHSYSPLQDKLNSLEWDGIDRIPDFFHIFLGAEKSDYLTDLTRLVLYGAIQRAFKPGVKFDVVPVLIDPEQGGGKSTICRFLALNDAWYTEDLKNLNTEKAFESLRGHWVVELGEMLITQSRKTAIERIKSFLSATTDNYRIPYDKNSQDWPRQCIFIGTSNNLDCLPNDITGNRRFFPVQCDKHKAERHPLQDEGYTRHYIEQLYAQAMSEGAVDYSPLTLDRKYDGHLEEIRETYTPDDSRIGMIQEWLDNLDANKTRVCSRMVYYEALNTEKDHEPDLQTLRAIAKILNTKITGWRPAPGKVKFSERIRGKPLGTQRAWVRVPKTDAELVAEIEQIELEKLPNDSLDWDTPF